MTPVHCLCCPANVGAENGRREDRDRQPGEEACTN